MVVAYLDSNVFGHIRDLDDGVTEAHVQKLNASIRDGALTVPGSVLVTEELVARVDPSFELCRLYQKIADLRARVKTARHLIEESARAYASRGAPVTPYSVRPEGAIGRWHDLLSGQAPAEDVDRIRARAKEQVSGFHGFMAASWPDGRAVLRADAQRHHHVRPFEDLWPDLSVDCAESLAKQAGVLRACRRRGIPGLLRSRPILAASGIVVRLLYSQLAEGRKPSRGDSRDLRHVVMATAVGGPFVTHDSRLAERVRGIPGLGMEVLRLPELLNRL